MFASLYIKTTLFLFSAVFMNPFVSSNKPEILIGKVYDASGAAAADAEIINLNNHFATVTNAEGSFALRGKKGDKLQVKFKNQSYNHVAEKIQGLEIHLIISDTKTEADYSRDGIVSEERTAAIKIRGSSSVSEASGTTTVGAVLEGKVLGMSTSGEVAHEKVDVSSARSSDRSVYSDKNIAAGQLTAGEVNDFSHFEYWQDLSENDLEKWKKHWEINPAYRYSAVLTNRDGYPMVNRTLHLAGPSDNIIWTAKTDNTGRAELWYRPEDLSIQSPPRDLKILDEQKNMLVSNAVEFKNGINFYSLDEDCSDSQKINIAFMIDATGSMGDELGYLQAELYDVIERTKKELHNSDLKIGSVFYRDTTDEYLVKNFDFTSRTEDIISFIKKQRANGGGDYPEAVVEAFEESLNQLSWEDDAETKLLFVLLDAPPHYNPENLDKLKIFAKTAARKGIRVIPLAASGIDKSTEFLMRSIALQTNGTYLFLTDHSGIGNPHIEPSTESYQVEMFNDMLMRIILQFTEKRSCTNRKDYPENSQMENKIKAASDIKWSFYPNPTKEFLNVKTNKEADGIFLFDTSGKLIFYKNHSSKNYRLNLSGLPAAVYYLKVIVDKRELYGKVIKQ
jgi:hypothetical protein